MNCSNLVDATGWVCAPAGRNALLVHAPLPLGDDGQLASFYILNDTPSTFYLTDSHAAILHAVDRGAKITAARIRKAASVPGLRFASISEDGEITASGELSDLQPALWDALRATLAITNSEQEWLPRTQQERFASRVGHSLRRNMGNNRVVTKPRLTGASGRQIEFPLGIRVGDSFIRAIQTIGISEGRRVDWGHIYQSLGKLTDLKKAGNADIDNRLVVIEGGAPKDEYSRAVTVLSDVARVIEFADNGRFAELVAA